MEIVYLHLLIDYHQPGEGTDQSVMLDVPWHAHWYHVEGSNPRAEIYFYKLEQ